MCGEQQGTEDWLANGAEGQVNTRVAVCCSTQGRVSLPAAGDTLAALYNPRLVGAGVEGGRASRLPAGTMPSCDSPQNTNSKHS